MDDEKLKFKKDEDMEIYQIKTNNNKKFIIGYIIFCLLLICIMSIIILITIKGLNVDDTFVAIKQENAETKRDTKDKKYVIKSYADTYDTNAINIKKYYNISGTIMNEEEYNSNPANYLSNNSVNFIQIEGLKDKELENKINTDIKRKAYELRGTNINTYVTANFSNMLSIIFYNNFNNIDTLNIDLSTGNEIKFEEIFISTAPINSYLADALYKTLAWQSLSIDENGNEENDMNNVDTSEYEDKFLMLIKNYNKNKQNLKFSITSNSISVYNLIDKNIINNEHAENIGITIDLIDYIDQVAMYKRYLTNKNIYENNDLALKEIIVFTGNYELQKYNERISYGKLQKNIFVEENLFNDNRENNINVAKEYVKKISEEEKTKLINDNDSKKGTFYQAQYNIWFNKDAGYYQITRQFSNVKCKRQYFENEAFLDYIKLKAMPSPSVDTNMFSYWGEGKFPNFEIVNSGNEMYFIDKEGNFLGNTREQAEEKLRPQEENAEEGNDETEETNEEEAEENEENSILDENEDWNIENINNTEDNNSNNVSTENTTTNTTTNTTENTIENNISNSAIQENIINENM